LNNDNMVAPNLIRAQPYDGNSWQVVALAAYS
jgi:hypothetical protein